MTITNDQTDLSLEEYPLRASGHIASEAWRRPTASQCECPDFCPVQHDNDN